MVGCVGRQTKITTGGASAPSCYCTALFLKFYFSDAPVICHGCLSSHAYTFFTHFVFGFVRVGMCFMVLSPSPSFNTEKTRNDYYFTTKGNIAFNLPCLISHGCYCFTLRGGAVKR